ncbi:MAG TPA: heme ABC exporter ATP-binding protein CcmA [Alphaproteobacteria bacterium]|nr:heme ABC exporter ATP-binding protein CcmA [Alphaproteobacteria bacterium]
MLTAESLACRRGRRLVFRDLSFALDAGDLLLVTGRNGCGKSSLLRVLAGFLLPMQGTISWQNEPVMDRALHAERLHYLGHLDAAKPELTVAEMCDYWRTLRRAPRVPGRQFLEPFGLADLAQRRIRYLSAGQKRRLALTRLTLDDAPLWLLDEPTSSLDRKSEGLLAGLVAQHRAKGGVAIIATHHTKGFDGAKYLALDGTDGGENA